MNKQARHEWILGYLRTRQGHYTFCRYSVDVLDAAFVDAYIDATEVPYDVVLLGANRCRQAGLDLAALCKEGKLERHRAGVSAPTSGGGWPTWVWSYYLPKDDKK